MSNLLKWHYQKTDRPLLILAVLLIITVVNLFCFGLVTELLMRTYHESQRRPIYRIRDVVGKSELGLVFKIAFLREQCTFGETEIKAVQTKHKV